MEEYPDMKNRVYPLYLAQQEIYYDLILNDNKSCYTIGAYLVLDGEISTEILLKVIKKIPKFFDSFLLKIEPVEDEPQISFNANIFSFFDVSHERNPFQYTMKWIEKETKNV